jgi:hypothetical protein
VAAMRQPSPHLCATSSTAGARPSDAETALFGIGAAYNDMAANPTRPIKTVATSRISALLVDRGRMPEQRLTEAEWDSVRLSAFEPNSFIAPPRHGEGTSRSMLPGLICRYAAGAAIGNNRCSS